MQRVEVREQVAAEIVAARLDAGPRRRQQPRLERHRRVATDPRELPALQRAEQRTLRLQRQILELVDEQRAGAGALQHAGRDLSVGLGAEQHLLGAIAAQRARDQRDERARRARTGIVDETRKRFAARCRSHRPAARVNRWWRSARGRRAAAASRGCGPPARRAMRPATCRRGASSFQPPERARRCAAASAATAASRRNRMRRGAWPRPRSRPCRDRTS